MGQPIHRRREDVQIKEEWVLMPELMPYEISSEGRVRNSETKEMMPIISEGDRKIVSLPLIGIKYSVQDLLDIHFPEDLGVNLCQKPVVCLETGEVFYTQADAAKAIQVHQATLCNAMRNHLKCGGFTWDFRENVKGKLPLFDQVLIALANE